VPATRARGEFRPDEIHVDLVRVPLGSGTPTADGPAHAPAALGTSRALENTEVRHLQDAVNRPA